MFSNENLSWFSNFSCGETHLFSFCKPIDAMDHAKAAGKAATALDHERFQKLLAKTKFQIPCMAHGTLVEKRFEKRIKNAINMHAKTDSKSVSKMGLKMESQNGVQNGFKNGTQNGAENGVENPVENFVFRAGCRRRKSVFSCGQVTVTKKS